MKLERCILTFNLKCLLNLLLLSALILLLVAVPVLGETGEQETTDESAISENESKMWPEDGESGLWPEDGESEYWGIGTGGFGFGTGEGTGFGYMDDDWDPEIDSFDSPTN